ncbi:conidiation-specific protein 10 [Aspergillus terreus NIH2624]|uniref:Conidiation-specific protein 10 n=1 Tax=Aspergillus terreus (strain NIH 2624 / FGSC A1156) TaxID=341663 RepID=Q0CMC2_ASPTN|nr:conidiation-specific protein 10 [Aspergillus terreus NIH2624]EAU34231.1 conidiation-specific protein 10 [Aspergillus terreus NIH2624]
MSSQMNPGNFANRPQEEVEDIARKGGQSSHQGGFASMDPDKQRDISSQGGKASSGSFDTGETGGSPSERRASSKYAFTHDELSHPDE